MDNTHTRAPFEDISSVTFRHRIQNDKDAVILDVRTRDEFDEGHIPGAINRDILDGSLEEEIPLLDKAKTYYVYCRSGGRSGHACLIMSDEGLNVVNLAGGFMYWDGEVE